MANIPKKYNHVDVESKWLAAWEEEKLYRWDPSRPREETFVVDTPPPTVSGSLHVGHVFSYTHTDIIVRYQRMCGKNIMYPMGWDDNGLPTERRVQNKFNIQCNPRAPYDPDWKPSESNKEWLEVSRQNFIEACEAVTSVDEQAFEDLWRRLGLSVEWGEQYETINDHSRRISQHSFLDLVDKGLVSSREAPTMWDVDYKTALAQADIEDRERKSFFNDIEFGVEGGGNFIIGTTRPELLSACIAVVAHPEDERYKKLFDKRAITPLYHAPVPIVASAHADPEKGTGIMMVCTFGDAADVEWWKASGLPIKRVIGEDGTMLSVSHGEGAFQSLDAERAKQHYAEIAGKRIEVARKIVVEQLKREGSSVAGSGTALQGEPKPIEHPVKFYEKGERPIEFVTTRQWFISILAHKERLLEQGHKVIWHPAHMRTRYEHWVEGLQYDWCISRQRFFGVPFPVWYRVDAEGQIDYEQPIYADKSSLPVDPLSQPAPGFSEGERDKPGGFSGDPDVMDTWATSSMTPQIVSKWGVDEERHKKLFPMDIRPQSHEIIRTWAFYTIAKAYMHEDTIPWKNVVISGWILDPDRKKMSKSKGNVVTPGHLLEEYSSDAVRYWAGRARLGVDTAFDEKVFKNGKKLATKIFNASRFTLGHITSLEDEGALPGVDAITSEVDRAFVDLMRSTIQDATDAFDRFEYALALQHAEQAFWNFCDNYMELIKGRVYREGLDEGRVSAVATLRWALGVFLRLFAPSMPFISEEVWSWWFREKAGKSIHVSSWPSAKEVEVVADPSQRNILDCAREVVDAARQEKSNQQKTLKWPVAKLELAGSKDAYAALQAALEDVRNVARLEPDALSYTEAKSEDGSFFSIAVSLADSMPE